VDTGWKRTYWDSSSGDGLAGDGKIVKGDTFEVIPQAQPNKWYYGDGDISTLQVLVLTPDSVDHPDYTIDQALGLSELAHTYENAGPWQAGFFGCCRLSARQDVDPPGTAENGLNNNGDFKWDVKTKVDLSGGPSGGQDRSPRAVGKPILRLRMDFVEHFDITAIDDDEDKLTWRLAVGDEMGQEDAVQPGYGDNRWRDGYPNPGDSGLPMTEANKLVMEHVDIQYINDRGERLRLGVATWDTNGLQTGYWQSTIMIEGGKAVTPFDYLMELKDPQGNAPPVWTGPTPDATKLQSDSLRVFCTKTVTFTMRADDPQKGGEEGAPFDTIDVIEVNPPPTGLVNSPVSVVPESGSMELNPVQVIASWTPTCGQLGKYPICYQATDNNPVQSLDSRVRCVIVTVEEMTNDPPIYTDDVPKDNEELMVLLGQELQFVVSGTDNDPGPGQGLGGMSVVWDDLPAGAIASPSLAENTGDLASVSSTFSWTPMDVGATEICFEVKDNHPDLPKSAGKRCIFINVRTKPVFVDKDVIDSFVGKETTMTLEASDANLEDTVTIAFADGPINLPSSRSEPVLVVANPGTFTITFSPEAFEMGQTFEQCFTAIDTSKDHLQGPPPNEVVTQCVTIRVVSPDPRFVKPTPEGADPSEATVFTAVGCSANFVVQAADPNNFPVMAQFIQPDPDSNDYSNRLMNDYTGLPEGASVVREDESRVSFKWKPARGQESFIYKTCWSAEDGGGVQKRTRCISIVVRRCQYCVQEGESLLSIADEYGTHWTQLYSSNQAISTHPDKVEPNTQVHLGPVYKVREGDTLMSIAARYGVSVNSLLKWNPDVAQGVDSYMHPRIGDTSSGGRTSFRDSEGNTLSDADIAVDPVAGVVPYASANRLSRQIFAGDQVCILPKTCWDTFGDKQRAFYSSGSYADQPTGFFPLSDPTLVAESRQFKCPQPVVGGEHPDCPDNHAMLQGQCVPICRYQRCMFISSANTCEDRLAEMTCDVNVLSTLEIGGMYDPAAACKTAIERNVCSKKCATALIRLAMCINTPPANVLASAQQMADMKGAFSSLSPIYAVCMMEDWGGMGSTLLQ